MEFWPENHSQSALYAKFGSIPGRNFSHNCSLTTHSLPDRHQAAHYPLPYGPQDHSRGPGYWTGPGPRTERALEEYSPWSDPELPAPSHFPFILERRGEYHQARDWTAAPRAAKEHERALVREAWQRRWEPCGPARYGRELPAKRSDSSYRELEAWAARYCHSLPRRRRLEAELRGRAADRDRLRPASVSAAWDPTYYQPRATSPETSSRRPFSQPPDYTAPPPYNGPAADASDTGWEQGGRTRSYRPPDSEHDSKAEDGRETCPEQDGAQEDVQAAARQEEEPPTTVAAQSQQTSSKIIEGRKFRLNKKTGGLTVFCLVARTAGATETPSLPLCITPTSIPGVAGGGSTRPQDRSRRTHLPDEVDSSRSERSEVERGDAGQMLEDAPSDASGNAGPESKLLTDANPTLGRESKQPASVKYPLWREPGFTSRAEAASSSTSCLNVPSEDRPEPLSQEERPQPGPPEGSRGLWVIDTSCVVVKMERIPSPDKEQVQYVADPRAASGCEGHASSLLAATPPASETLEERAQRILGIPLHESITEAPDEEAELPAADGLIPEETKDVQAGQTQDAVRSNNEDFAASQDDPWNVCEEDGVDRQLETDDVPPQLLRSPEDASGLAGSALTALSYASEPDEDLLPEPTFPHTLLDPASPADSSPGSDHCPSLPPPPLHLTEQPSQSEFSSLDDAGGEMTLEEPGTHQLEAKTSGERSEVDAEHLGQTCETCTDNQSPEPGGGTRSPAAELKTDGGEEAPRTDVADAAAGRPCVHTQPVRPDAAGPESVPAPDLGRFRDQPSSSAAPQQEDEGAVLDVQHPTSLWDAVNRIRKHTAPDSENEEEDASELWDPESSGQGPARSGGTEDRKSRKTGSDEAEQQEASSEGRVEDVAQVTCPEDDAVSCSSASSHSSGDTVIVAEEDTVQETTPDAGTESETDEGESQGEEDCPAEPGPTGETEDGDAGSDRKQVWDSPAEEPAP